LLAVQALTPQNVFVVYLPAKASDPRHLTQVQLLIKQTKLPKENFTLIPISGMVQKVWKGIKRESGFHKSLVAQNCQPGLSKPKRQELTQLNRLRLANLAVRLRMIALYDQAKLLDALVVGTENYSEHLLGYYTRFGDEASDLEPIRHLYKTQVYQLAQHLKIPQAIIEQEPTAGLWSGQTDESELGFSYRQADPILYLLQNGKTEQAIIKLGFNGQLVSNVLTQVKGNHFKSETPYTLA
jgi:NAD+ synthase